MMKYKVFVAYPIYDKPDQRSVMSRDKHISLSKLCEVQLFSVIGDSAISRVRDKSINAFLRSDCHFFMTWDDDVQVVDFPDKSSIFDTWAEAGKDFIGALVAKTGSARPIAGWNIASAPMKPSDLNSQERWIEMRWLGGALTFLRRETVQKIYDAHPELEYDAVGFGEGTKERALYIETIAELENGIRRRLTEDYALCERWRKLGGKIYADREVITIHWGIKGWVARPEFEMYSNCGVF